MKLITLYWKKLLYLLITGATSVFIAACYGPAMIFTDAGRWLIKVKSEDNKPIPGLDVEVLQFEDAATYPYTTYNATTDSSGTARFMFRTTNEKASRIFQAVIKDIDGSDNGGLYSDTLLIKNSAEESTVVLKKL